MEFDFWFLKISKVYFESEFLLLGGVCFMNFLIWGFLNDFINSSGIIFEFHYNFIIFFCVWVPRFYTKNFNFFLPPIPPKKNQKMTILTKFGHFGTSWHCSDLFLPPIPPKNPKNDYFGKIWPFWHFLALFWGGVKIAKKKIMLFKYSPLATQNSKNFYTHCFLSFLR